MAQKLVRKQVAVITAGLAAAALLIGPGVTWGLDVPLGTSSGTTTQVTSAVQDTVDTTQQAAATTVTTVETTVQSTVDTTQAATQQTATTVTAPAQTSTRAVSSAPKASVPRASVTAPKKTTVAATPNTVARQIASTTTLAQGVAVAGRTAVTDAVRKKAKAVAAPSSSPDTTQAAPACDLSLLEALPGASQLEALLAVVCDAGRSLLDPAGASSAGTPAKPLASIDRVLGLAGGSGPHARAAGVALRRRPGAINPQLLGSAGGRAADGAQASASQAGWLRPSGSAFAAYPAGGSAAGNLAGAHGAGAHHRQTFFTGPVTGAFVLTAIFILSLAVLAGIGMWRAAQRWIVPRFV